MEHRANDDKSKDYNLLELAEQTAKKEKKGVHSPDLLSFSVTDLTLVRNI
jgi:hypothetical protein